MAGTKTLLESFDTFLLDCDGVIWRGSQLIEGVKETLALIRSHNKKILFVTNNSTKSRMDYVLKFKALGIEASQDEIFGSSYASAYYIANILKFPADKKAYVCGMKGICDELEEQGIRYFGGPSDDDNFGDMTDILDEAKADPEVGAVVFGLDLNINYKKYCKAFTYLHNNPDCHFIATNSDSTFPASEGVLFPGAGSLLSVLTHSLKREAVVIGKPNKTMLDVIVEKYHLDRDRTCMVGDRLDTDVAFGKLGGVKTILVMSGKIHFIR